MRKSNRLLEENKCFQQNSNLWSWHDDWVIHPGSLVAACQEYCRDLVRVSHITDFRGRGTGTTHTELPPFSKVMLPGRYRNPKSQLQLRATAWISGSNVQLPPEPSTLYLRVLQVLPTQQVKKGIHHLLFPDQHHLMCFSSLWLAGICTRSIRYLHQNHPCHSMHQIRHKALLILPP